MTLEFTSMKNLPLGKMSDSAISEIYSVDRRRVCYHRNKLKIPPFIGGILTQEGDGCRSVYEAMLDAVFHERDIAHKHEVKIPGLSYISDFLVGNTYVEIAGMLGFKKYQNKHRKKRQDYENLGIPAIWLFPDDVRILYKDCSLALKCRTLYACAACGKKTRDIVKGYCRKCYCSYWHNNTNLEEIVCKFCKKPIMRNAKENRIFCSTGCYSESLKLDWPPWGWVREQLKEKSIRQIAFDIQKKPSSLYMRIRRARQRGEIGF